MPNITLSLDDGLLDAGRRYEQEHGLTLNALIRDLLTKTVSGSPGLRLAEAFRLADKHHFNSKAKKWKRGDLYDV